MKELLTSFGQLKAFNLVKDVTSGLSKVSIDIFIDQLVRLLFSDVTYI